MKTFRRLLTFVLPFWPQVLLATVLGALTIGASISLMSTSAYLISVAALHPGMDAISVAVVGVRFFGISRGVFRYLERLTAHSLTFRVLAKLRVWFYQAIEPLAPARLMSSRSGDLLNRVMADVETLDNLYVRVLAPPLVAIVVLLGMSVFMSSFAPLLGLVLTIFLLAIGLGLTTLTLTVNQKPGRSLTDERGRLRADLVDAVQGLPDLVAFGQEKAYLTKIRATGGRFSSAQTRMARLSGLQSGLNSLLTGLGVWCLLVLAIPLVTSGAVKGVHLAVIILGAMASFEAVQNLPQAAQLLESNLQSARRLFEIADAEPAVKPPAEPLPRPSGAGLRVRNLTFAYEAAPQTNVLAGINFDLPTGKKLAIVGPSGAGKTTIANLLMRFWEFSSGEILLDGQDLRRYTPVDARRMFSLVSQGTYLFNASLRENLLLAHPWASPEEIEIACRQAELHEFVTGLPKGYETLVGERGLQFSGGERQRVAIARALLKDAPLFIFDEPTANLDPGTERRLLKTLQRVTQDKSVLWITHRLIGLEAMDEILVMDQGRIVERGTHAGLLAQDGLYKKLWDLQNRALILREIKSWSAV
ncbi:MAG: thiol reductant ABC exporter subunit CydC [Chloroflexi bacterium]|nr:thiol reductant ABC exporter subunit CydC [Chloroflexota bacterium]